jgi:protein involved in plasmid replication-relaxation
MVKQQASRTKQRSYQLTAVDFEILQLVHQYHFLKVEQVMNLRGYSSGTLTTVQTRLQTLSGNNPKIPCEKYLERRQLPYTQPGNTNYIYYLSTNGQHALEQAGVTGFNRVRKSEIDRMAFPHLQHVLDLNDLLIAASLLPRSVPSISLVEWRHDLDLKKTPVKVTVERRLPYGDRIDEKVTVIPDGWLDFRMVVPDRPKPRRRCIVVELDRGTTSVAPFKQKLRALYFYAISEDYQELFGTDLCMVAYATTAGKQRLSQMIEWCEQELEQQRLEHEANLYRFTVLPDGDLDSKQVFCAPVWYKPFESEPVPLLWQL